MIFHPRVNQHVRVHYAKALAAAMPHHDKIGVVRIVARGPGPGTLAWRSTLSSS